MTVNSDIGIATTNEPEFVPELNVGRGIDRIVDVLDEALRMAKAEDDSLEMSALRYLISCSRSAAHSIGHSVAAGMARAEISMAARSALTCATMLVREPPRPTGGRVRADFRPVSEDN